MKQTVPFLGCNTPIKIYANQHGLSYHHKSYQKILKDKDIIQSMSRKGNCLGNAMMENFFGLMKNELLYINKFDSIDNFEKKTYKVYLVV